VSGVVIGIGVAMIVAGLIGKEAWDCGRIGLAADQLAKSDVSFW